MNVLVNEVRKSELTTYKTTIMALVNAIIFANENIRDRIRIRGEFIGKDNLIEYINRHKVLIVARTHFPNMCNKRCSYCVRLVNKSAEFPRHT